MSKDTIDKLNRLEFFYWNKPTKKPEVLKQDKEQVEKDFALIRKELKVLKIIKNKKVQVYNLMYYIQHKANPRKFYNFIFDKDNMFLTEEEYNLLKEWIEDLLCGM